MRNYTRSNLRRILPGLALAVALPAIAWTAIERLTLQPESRLWVEGTSTIRSFSCKAGEVNATVEGAPNSISQLAAGQKAITTVRVSIPAESMDCGNGTMNDHMKKALKVSENPNIEFTLSGYDLARGADGITGTLNGALTLGGVKLPVSIPAEGKVEAGALHVTGSYPLKMTDYDLTPPSLMFGRIKVREMVNVKFDLLLKS